VAAGGFAIASAVEAAAGPVATALANGQPARVARHLVEGRRRLGGHLAHAGMAVVLVAVAASSSGRQVREVSVRRGETVAIGSYQVRLAGVRYYPESNRDGFVGVFGIERDGALLGALGPRLDRYRGTGETLGSPAVLSTPKEDLYLTLLSLDPVGAAVVALGGVLALPLPRRKRAAIVAPALKEARA
jgi:cytochrome c-type biogenesis protein CcmF